MLILLHKIFFFISTIWVSIRLALQAKHSHQPGPSAVAAYNRHQHSSSNSSSGGGGTNVVAPSEQTVVPTVISSSNINHISNHHHNNNNNTGKNETELTIAQFVQGTLYTVRSHDLGLFGLSSCVWIILFQSENCKLGLQSFVIVFVCTREPTHHYLSGHKVSQIKCHKQSACT